MCYNHLERGLSHLRNHTTLKLCAMCTAPGCSLSHLRNHTTLKRYGQRIKRRSSLSHLRNHTTLKRSILCLY